MKPSFAPVTSGPLPCAKAPFGSAARAAIRSAIVAADLLRNLRREKATVPMGFVISLSLQMQNATSKTAPYIREEVLPAALPVARHRALNCQ
jgi:hypothetical protein